MTTPLRSPPRYVLPVGTVGRCGLSCAWCEHCRGADQPSYTPDPPALPGEGAITVRLKGGDPIGHADLPRWIAWARRRPDTRVELEGHALTLDSPERIEALASLGVDLIRLTLPGVDPERVAGWTGAGELVQRTLDAVESLCAAGVSVHIVVPVNPLTVGALGETVMALAESFGARVPLVLSHRPLRSREGRRELDPARLWTELDALDAVLRGLPATLPGGAALWIDEMEGYGACVLPDEGWRRDLIPVSSADEQRLSARQVDPSACGGCALSRRCEWRVQAPLSAPSGRMVPLDAERGRAVVKLGPGGALTRERAPARELPAAIAGRLCVAPWTTLTLYSKNHHPVPCAPAWVDTRLDLAALQRDGFIPAGRLARAKDYDVASDSWPLMEMWNGPLYRQMRAQMRDGSQSDRCRASCRVILGVEERGSPFYRIPDAQLAPTVAENRRRLLDEIARGVDLLSATPLELTLGVSAHCNFTCGFCTGPQGAFGELSEARLAEVMSWLPGLMQLSVVGPGEPLMSVTFNRLLDELATGRYPSLRVSMTTNGTLLRPRWVERHASISWGQLRMSVNAGSAAVHERMTGKRLWEQLVENIEAVVALRDRRDPPFEFALSCVLSQLVMGELHAFAALVDRTRALPILEPMTGNLGDLSPYVNEARTRRLRDECREIAAHYAGRNASLAAAFEAMARFAEDRLRGRRFEPLPAS